MAQKRRRRRRKQMKITQWFKKLSTRQKVLLISCIALLVLMLAGVIYVASIFNKLNTEDIKEDEIFMISPSIFCSFVVILIISPTLAMSKMKSKYMLFIF